MLTQGSISFNKHQDKTKVKINGFHKIKSLTEIPPILGMTNNTIVMLNSFQYP